MKALTYLVTAATLALTATGTVSSGHAERGQLKNDYVEKSLDPLVPGTKGAKVTTVKYG